MEKAMKAESDERYVQYLHFQEFQVKLKEDENKRSQKMQELWDEKKKRHVYNPEDPNDEISDYEISERDLYPPKRVKFS